MLKDFCTRQAVWAALAVVVATSLPAMAQDGFGGPVQPVQNGGGYRVVGPQTRFRPGSGPTLSETTAILESAVRTMYARIEPGNDTSPNELLVYADLRAMRLYIGALEVAGWSLEQEYVHFLRHQTAGAYRNGYGQCQDPQAQAAYLRFRSYRETCRTLLFRVRMTAVSVEHQVAVCAPELAREWREQILPSMRDLIASTEPIFYDQFEAGGYQGQGQGIPAQPIQFNNNNNGFNGNNNGFNGNNNGFNGNNPNRN